MGRRNASWQANGRGGMIVFSALALGMAVAAVAEEPPPAVRLGEHLVLVGGCDDCHTPFVMGENGPEKDMSRRLAGHPQSPQLPPPPALGEGPWNTVGSASSTAYAGPWGITFAANLTPDPQTGLGGWTADQFVRAIKTGKHLGSGRPIMPPMPWTAYRHYSEDELRAIFAYLQSLPAVVNRVPEYQPPAAPGPDRS